MEKCKNIECFNYPQGKKIYCSFKCRNYYVNKYLRDYTKNGLAISEKARESYNLLPKKCFKCNNNISYENNLKKRKYCSKECSSSCINLNRKGIKHNMTEEGILILKTSACDKLHNISYQNHIDAVKKYEDNPNMCPNCSSIINYVNKNKIYCSNNCVKEFRRKAMSDFLIYKQDASFKFSLNSFPNEFDFTLIEKYGWYSPSNSKKPNIKGVSRDHMISIREGFNTGIDAKLLSHPANCKLMPHSDNISKNKKSSITKDELFDRIIEWELKYPQ